MELITPLILMAWATQADGAMLIDVVGIGEETQQRIAKKHGASFIPPDSPDVPRRLRTPEWSLVTIHGVEKVRPTAIQFTVGANVNHAYLRVKPRKQAREGLAVAGAVHPSAKLVKLEAGADKRMLKLVNTAYAKARPQNVPARLRRFARKRLGAKHVTVVSGRFAKADAYVFVSVPLARKGRPDNGYISATAAVKGEQVIWLSQPEKEQGTQNPRYLVDLDGNGSDEIVVESSYHEGEYTQLLDDTKTGEAAARLLSGDGA